MEKLLDLLKRPEYRVRYTAKIELRERNRDEVRAALDAWLAGLDAGDPRFPHHQTEALWATVPPGCGREPQGM